MIDHCPASPLEWYLDGLELILGESGLEKLKRQDLDKDLLPFQALTMGSLAARLTASSDLLTSTGLSLMAGREEFSTLLRLCGEETRLLDPSTRMLPPRRRMAKGLEALLHWMNDSWGLACSLKEEGQTILVRLPALSGAGESKNSKAAAYFVQGLLQGMLTWISGGKFHTASLEYTDPGTEIRILKNPID